MLRGQRTQVLQLRPAPLVLRRLGRRLTSSQPAGTTEQDGPTVLNTSTNKCKCGEETIKLDIQKDNRKIIIPSSSLEFRRFE